MRILYFLDFPYNFGGASNEVLNQARLSQKSGNQVKVIIPTDEFGKYNIIYDHKCEDFELDYEHAYISVATEMLYVDVCKTIKAVSDAKRYIDEFAPDLIHSVQVNIAVELAAREKNIPNIMSVFQAKKETFYFDYLRVYPRYHVSDSDRYSALWQEALSIESRCIRMGYELNPDVVLKDIHAKTEIHMICVGVICKRKNQLGAIQLAKTLLEKGYQVHLDCWGQLAEEDYANECLNYIKKNHLQNAVFLKGFTMDARKEIQKADVLLSCSFSESFPVVIIEAFQNGTAVITTPVGGISEVVENGFNGYLTEGIQQEDIEKAFLQYYRDRESGKIITIIKNALRTYEDIFLEDKNFSMLMDYYHFVCKDYKENNTSESEEMSLTDFQLIWKQYFIICDEAEASDQYDTEEIELFRSKIWWIYHFKKKLEVNKARFFLWGAGFWGKRLYNLFQLFMPDINITGFIDSQKQGICCGMNIYKPDVLRKEDVVLISNMLNSDEIVSCLEQMDFKENISYYKFGG